MMRASDDSDGNNDDTDLYLGPIAVGKCYSSKFYFNSFLQIIFKTHYFIEEFYNLLVLTM